MSAEKRSKIYIEMKNYQYKNGFGDGFLFGVTVVMILFIIFKLIKQIL
jgi:uncharacterized protein HemY